MENLQIITVNKPKSPISEAYRTLRTNIQFSSIDSKPKTLLITSSSPREGKTTTAVNLAVSIAQEGKRTVLLDCDLRKPKIHTIFKISNEAGGLSNILIDEIKAEQGIKETEVPNLYVLPSGKTPPNPSELLSSQKMQQFMEYLRQSFDYIVIDSPPLIVVTDAQIISKYSDACILIVAAGESNRNAVIKAKELLCNVNANLIGVVLNKTDISRESYYKYYHYYETEKVIKKKRNRRGNKILSFSAETNEKIND